jgi:hypothetical protein
VQQADRGLQARALKAIGVCLHTRGDYTAGLQLHRSEEWPAPTVELLTSGHSIGVHFS